MSAIAGICAAGSRGAALALVCVAAAAARADPVADFEARCATLPASRYTVTADPITYREGETLTIDELTARSGRTPGAQMTMGLTTMTLGFQTRVHVQSVDYAAAGLSCATVDVVVNLSLPPLTIYLAQELDASRCAHDVTLEHELKHVAVFEQVQGETLGALVQSLPGALPPDPQRGVNHVELEQRLYARINAYVREVMRERQRVLDERQAAVDSPAEYARVKAACVP